MAVVPGRAAIQVLLYLYTAATVAVGDDLTCSPPSPRLAAETRLMSCLLDSYDRAVRPATSDADVITVHFEMKHLRVMELSTKTGVLRALGWLEKSWVDPQLAWKPSDYDSSITNIRIPAKKIWTPDIVQYHNVGDHDMSPTEVLAVVNSNGTVTWMTFIKLAARCNELMGSFPMDYHHCVIVFGSWTYNHTQLVLKLKRNDTEPVTYEGKSWHVTTTSLGYEYYSEKESGGAPFSNVGYTVTMLRVSAFYQETLALPTVLIAILTGAMFFVPPATGERLVLGIGLLLSSAFLLLSLEDVVTSDPGEIPSVAIYMAFDQVMLTAGIILSIIVYNCHHRNVKTDSVPECLRTVFLGRLSRLLCVPAEPYTRLPRADDADLDMSPFPYDSEPPTTDAASAATAGSDRALEATLQDIRKYLKVCAARATSGGDSSSHRQVVLNEWIQLARVVDRLLFIVFFTVTIVVFIIGPKVV